MGHLHRRRAAVVRDGVDIRSNRSFPEEII
jgi:hypothetical protein